jgi:cell division protein ZapA
MAHVSVTIDNRKYRLACNEGEEARLEQLASMIDSKIAELRGSFGEIGDSRLVVMAALTFADSLTEAKGTIEAERERNRAALLRADAAAAQMDALGARLEELAGRLAGSGED